MAGGDELLPVGQKSNYKKYIETTTTCVVAEQVATWAQASTAAIGHVVLDASTARVGSLYPSTEIIGYVKIDQTTPGASNAVTAVTTGGAALFTTGQTGKVQAMASTAAIGLVTALVSTAKIGALQASTESIGYVTALVSTAQIGHIVADVSTAAIGSLQASTESIGYVTALVSTAKIGALQPSTEVVGYIIANASTAKIGALQPSTESIGYVTALVSTAAIGHIIADASTAKIGALQASTELIGLLAASTAQIGHIVADVSTAAIGALQPSTAGIGQVGGHESFPQVTIATTTSGAYAAGDNVGGQLSFTSVFRSTTLMTGILQSVVIADKSTMQASLDLVLFHTDTTGTTYTNDAALTIADADLSKITATVSVYAGDYLSFADNGALCKYGLGLPVRATTGTGLTGAIVNRSTGPTYTSTGDLVLTLGFLVD